MNELEKLKYTKDFVEKLANGINPVDNTPIPEDDLLNNARISRCMYYVSDVLGQIIDAGGVRPKRMVEVKPKYEFTLTPEERSRFEFSDKPLPVSEITKRMNELRNNEYIRKISHRDITGWLLQSGFLAEKVKNDGKTKKFPTETGILLGASIEVRTSNGIMYDVVLYNKNAQEFILDNLDGIIEYRKFMKKNK